MSQATSPTAVFIGVNLTSDRVNIVAVTEQGAILAESSAPYARQNTSGSSVKNNLLEEDPEIWWDATRMALGHLVGQLQKITTPAQMKAISVSGDPGTLVVVNPVGNPIMPAILADDARAYDFVKSLNFHGREHCSKLGFVFRAEDPLAKIAWLKDNNPKLSENVPNVIRFCQSVCLGVLAAVTFSPFPKPCQNCKSRQARTAFYQGKRPKSSTKSKT